MTYELKAEVRTEPNLRALRRGGRIPGVVYGRGVHRLLTFAHKDLERLLNRITRSSRIELQVDGEHLSTFVRDVHYNPLNDQVLHIDLYQPPTDRPIKLKVPLRLVGEAKGAKAGGLVDKLRQAILVSGLAERIPEAVEVDISQMDIGESLHARDLALQDLQVLMPPEVTLVTVLAPRKEEAVAVEVEAEVAEEAATAGAPAETASAGESQQPEG
ncbi:MAG TPA: 50S ribosomal protein L25 [Candidatus Fraserbacteria bacterium]|nr:50S ribosomal protein L25 [Candidatus Fraserbacteria bacterium]